MNRKDIHVAIATELKILPFKRKSAGYFYCFMLRLSGIESTIIVAVRLFAVGRIAHGNSNRTSRFENIRDIVIE
jgi:hypothetical protein